MHLSKKIAIFMLFLIPFTLMLYFGKETFYIDDELTQAQQYDYHFVLITEEVGNDYWRLIEKGARKAAQEQNVYLEYIGPRIADDEERMDTFDRMITAGVDGILIKGSNANQFDDLVQKASNRNIPVATIDTDKAHSGRAFYIGTDNYRAGYLAGETLSLQTTGQQKVAVVIGNMEAQNQIARLNGFKHAIEAKDRIEIVDVADSNITKLGAAQATYQLVRSHPNITAFFGTSALDGIGIVQGIGERLSEEKPYIISFDILPETLEQIEKGNIQATIAQYPEEMGYQAVELMLDYKQNKSVNTFHHTETGVLDESHIHNGELVVPIKDSGL